MKLGSSLPNMRSVQTSDFDFQLPLDLIAQRPLAERSHSRLLVLESPQHSPRDRKFCDLPSLLNSGDLLVFNDTRVVPARLLGHKSSGGAVEMLLERALIENCALLQMRASKPLREGQLIHTAGGNVIVLGREGELYKVQLPISGLDFFTQFGSVPLPPYINRPPDGQDLERYQSLLARVPGAVAAPTASLHFDSHLIEQLQVQRVQHCMVTLHVGAGTFSPIRTENIDEHRMHAEYVVVSAATCAAINKTRAAGKRVIAVGTTVVRALESAALAGALDGGLEGWCGDTSIFIKPGFNFQVVDALVTNFHLPRSTLLMLVSAFVGREAILKAYSHAVNQRYRFFSYGDAMFLTRAIIRSDL